MRVLRGYIEIGGFTFDYVTDIEVVSSWNQFVDTATITIPKKLRYKGQDGKTRSYIVQGSEAVFKRGDRVKIQAGYYPTPEYGEVSLFNTIFEGYVAEISPTKPITIKCEDSMFQLKRAKIPSYDSTGKPTDLEYTLNALGGIINENAGGVVFPYTIKAESMDLGKMIVENNATYLQFLDMLKRKYGLQSYIRRNTVTEEEELIVGFARISQQVSFLESLPNRIITLRFGRDIIDYNDLTYRNAKDIDINLTCISIDEDNNKVEATAGEEWGSTRNLYYYNMSQTDLQKVADNMVNQFKFDGYRGSFTVFGIPQIKHGDAVRLLGSDIADNFGEYLVEKVVTNFGQGGFRQKVFLSSRIT